MISRSSIRSICPGPPGMQITSTGGQSAQVVVGNTVRPTSLVTGSIFSRRDVLWRSAAGQTPRMGPSCRVASCVGISGGRSEAVTFSYLVGLSRCVQYEQLRFNTATTYEFGSGQKPAVGAIRSNAPRHWGIFPHSHLFEIPDENLDTYREPSPILVNGAPLMRNHLVGVEESLDLDQRTDNQA